MSYPWTQGHYWWRSLFPTWSDWNIKVRPPSTSGHHDTHCQQKATKPSSRQSWKIMVLALLCIGVLGFTQSADAANVPATLELLRGQLARVLSCVLSR